MLPKSQTIINPSKPPKATLEEHGYFAKQISDNFVASTGVKLIIQGEGPVQGQRILPKAPDRLNLTRTEFNRLKQADLKDKEQNRNNILIRNKNEPADLDTNRKETKIDVEDLRAENERKRKIAHPILSNQAIKGSPMFEKEKIQKDKAERQKHSEESQEALFRRETKEMNPQVPRKPGRVGELASIKKMERDLRCKANGKIIIEDKKLIGRLVDSFEEAKNYKNNSVERYAIAELNKDDLRLMGPIRHKDLQNESKKEKDFVRTRSGPAIDRKVAVEGSDGKLQPSHLQTTESAFNLNNKEMYSTNPAVFRDLRATTKNFKKGTLGYRIKCPRQRSKLFCGE